jgi:hypothetical protein
MGNLGFYFSNVNSTLTDFFLISKFSISQNRGKNLGLETIFWINNKKTILGNLFDPLIEGIDTW